MSLSACIRRAALGALVILIAGTAGAVADDKGTIKYRKAVMRAIGGHMAAMATIVKGEGGSLSHLSGHATALAHLAKISQHLFPQTTSAAAGDTRALDQIWDNPREFKAVQEVFTAESEKLAKVAEGGDPRAIGAQLGVLGKNACKSCHTHFRKESE